MAVGALMAMALWGAYQGLRETEFTPTPEARELCSTTPKAKPKIFNKITRIDEIVQNSCITALSTKDCDHIDNFSNRQFCKMAVRDLQRETIWSSKPMRR